MLSKETQFLGCPSHNLVTIATMLPQFVPFLYIVENNALFECVRNHKNMKFNTKLWKCTHMATNALSQFNILRKTATFEYLNYLHCIKTG